MAERAVQVLNHRNMGSRYVEVFLSSEGEMSQANVSPPLGANGAPWQTELGVGAGGIVRLRGLPFNATPDLILQFFTWYDVPKGSLGVHLILGPNGRPNGEAFVEFASEEVADAALAKDRATIGTRYVEVFRATPEQMGQALLRVAKSNNLAPMPIAQASVSMAPYGYGGPFAIPTHVLGGVGTMISGPGADAVVKMRGLPYKATRNDILDFFPGLSVPLNGVHLMFNEREQPTGEAYVEFSSSDDRECAMAKDRQHIGGRYVEVSATWLNCCPFVILLRTLFSVRFTVPIPAAFSRGARRDAGRARAVRRGVHVQSDGDSRWRGRGRLWWHVRQRITAVAICTATRFCGRDSGPHKCAWWLLLPHAANDFWRCCRGAK